MIKMIFLCFILFTSNAFADFIFLNENDIKIIESKYDKENIYKNIKELNILIRELKDEENIAKKFTEINSFVNKNIKEVNDLEAYGVIDYWVTPKEALIYGGDCEDYAILKYFALIEVKINPYNLYFIVLDKPNQEDKHMVLGYFENEKSIPLIFDNLTNHILKLTSIDNITPLIAFNELDAYSFAVSNILNKKINIIFEEENNLNKIKKRIRNV